MKKIYIAGPEVFLNDAINIGEQKKELCNKYGLIGLFPLDNIIDFSSDVLSEQGLEISIANEELIKEADYIVANITPFRGTSADVGTVYELGLAKGLGKVVYAYSNDVRSFLTRNLDSLPNVKKIDNDHYVDELGMTLENFDLIDNLMIDGAVSYPIIQHKVDDIEQLYRDLTAFEQCLMLISK